MDLEASAVVEAEEVVARRERGPEVAERHSGAGDPYPLEPVAGVGGAVEELEDAPIRRCRLAAQLGREPACGKRGRRDARGF